MIKNYLLVAWRNVIANKVFSLINILGLSISMACCLLIGLFIWNQLSFDNFHQQAANIYRVTTKQHQPGGIYHAAVTPGLLAPSLKKDFAEIKETVRFGKWSGMLKNGTNSFVEKNILFADNSIFSVFNFELVKGNPAIALLKPNEIVITETAAEKFFGKYWNSNPSLIGQTFTLKSETEYLLAGVVKNPPLNSSISFDYLLPFQYIVENDKWGYKWNSNNYHTYLQLTPGTNLAAFSKKIKTKLHTYNPETNDELELQPLAKQYLFSEFDFNTDWGPRSNVKYIRIFGGVALLLLIIACVNFVNLSTARSAKRAMEVGLRKVVGASRRQLVIQFLMESLMITFIAGLLAILLAQMLLPFFNAVAGSSELSFFSNRAAFAMMALFVLVIAIAAGSYPAFVLSSFIPVKVLKGVFQVRSGAGFRQSLMVLQFTIAVVLSVGAMFMYRQLQYMQRKDLGFNKDELISVGLAGNLREKSLLYKRDLQQQTSIAGVTTATVSLVDVNNSSNVEWEGMQPKDEFLITQANADPDMIPVTQMQLVQGKNFSQQLTNDTATFILNQTAANRMGYYNNAVGKKIKFWGAEGKVIGVVKDFNFKPLSSAIEPFIFRYQPGDFYFTMLVKARAGRSADAIAQIEKFYKKYETANPVQFSFVNEALNKVYETQQRTSQIILFFCCLVVFVACIGLYGLVSFSAAQRTKEIGIRKILGATVASITLLLASGYIRLILLAILIAVPVAWYAVDTWLQGFAYRIHISPWIFAVAGCAIIFIAMITVSLHAIKAGIAKPVNSLRVNV